MKFLRRFFIRLSNFAQQSQSRPTLAGRDRRTSCIPNRGESARRNAAAEARRQAALKLGAGQAIREQHHAEETLPLLENLLFDLRYAVRTLSRSPGFALVAIATMALGIGATTAIYSVIDATLLHPLSYPHPTELVRIHDDLPGVGAKDVGMSIPELQDLQNSGIFQYASLYGFGSVNLTGTAQPARIAFRPVTPAYFAVLGVTPQLGRTFDPHDSTPGFNLEVVISDGLWKRAFGADPHIVGKTLRLDNDEYRVVGVMPPGFRDQGSSNEERETELWAASNFAGEPAPPPLRSSRLLLGVIGRVKPELSLGAAQQHIDTLVSSLKKQYPEEYPAQSAWSVRLIPLSESMVGSIRQSLVMLFGAVGLVLLISCVNVANLLLARAGARGREIAVRQALGASRTRLIRQLLTESLLLFLLGGIAGFGILFCTQRLLVQFIPESLPRIHDISISWGLLLFAVTISVAAGVIFGLAPAWLASRLDLTGTLRQEGRGSGGSQQRSRARRVLAISELALSLVLMVAAGLLLRSFWDLFQVQLGFNPDRIMAVQTWLPVPNDPKTDIYGTVTQESALLREILRRNRTLPGVEEVAIGNMDSLPLGHGRDDFNVMPLIREGLETNSNRAPQIDSSTVSPEYFHLLGMTLLRGRLFNEQDVSDTPLIAVINESAARTYWPGQEPIGRRIRIGRTKPTWVTIAGVIADARTESLADAGVPKVYLSAYQHHINDLAIYLRGQLDPAAIPAQVRGQVQSINAELPVFNGETLDDVLSTSLSVRRFSMELVAFFAATALLLAGLGIYGTISYLVNEQTREIAIRLALGAQRGTILNMVLRQGLGMAAVGASAGLAGALIVSHLMAGLLFGVSPTDLPTFAGVTLVLAAVALAASCIPALRAMRLDPNATLHS